MVISKEPSRRANTAAALSCCGTGAFGRRKATQSAAAARKGELGFTLDGERLQGSFVLVRMKRDRDGGKRTNWLLIKHRDEHASEGAGEKVLASDTSIASGRSMAAIAAGKGRAPKPSCSRTRPSMRAPCGIPA